MNIIVLAGGDSPERDVSLRSGAAVAAALQERGYEVALVDPAGGIEKHLSELQASDIVFPALHGAGGEDGVLQKFLEDSDISFVGSGSEASALCYDKSRYTELMLQHDILSPTTEMVDYARYTASELAKQPFVLKPNDGGSSIDTFIVRNVADKNEVAIQQAFEAHNQLLLQQLIDGDEITVAIIGEESLPVIEIIPPASQEFDYENKYNGATQELCPPQHVSQDHQFEAQKLAMEIHELTGCRDLSRTDIMISPDGQLYVLETNTIPGLTDQSLLPGAAAVAGYDMPTLCDLLVKAALQRRNH